MGPGAVGCYFGGRLAQAGAAVTLFGRPGQSSAHLEAVARDGLLIRSQSGDARIALDVASGGRALAASDVVLFCVKTVDTESAARMLVPDVGREVIVVSLQNGVDNVERMEAAGLEALPAVVFVAAAIERPGEVVHRGRGDLMIGHARRTADVARVAALFERAGVTCRVVADIEHALWMKMGANSMANAISALTGATYGRIASDGPAWELAEAVGREVAAVARASGIALDERELIRRTHETCHSVGPATSSTQQDIAHGRPTEIDALNGYVDRRARELGLSAPANRMLWSLIKLRERPRSPASS